MNLADLVLGIFGIYAGAQTVSASAKRLRDGIRPPARGDLHGGIAVLGGEPAGFKTSLHPVKSLDDRIRHIASLAHKGKSSPEVIEWTRMTLSKKCPVPGKKRTRGDGEWCIPEKDTEAEIEAIYYALRESVRYTSDVRGVDTYAHPKQVLRMRAEDCDGYAALGAAALMSVGIHAKMKVIRTTDATDWNHIYLLAGNSKDGESSKWKPVMYIPLDASVPATPGWEAPRGQVAEAREFDLDDYS